MRLITIIIASIFISVNVFAQGKIIVRVGSGGTSGTTDTSSLSNRIQQRIDSLRNNAGTLEARKGGVFVPQFVLPSGGGGSNPLSIINPQLRGPQMFNMIATGQSNIVGGSLVSPPGVDTSMDARIQVWDSAANKFVTAINGVNYPQYPTPSSPTSAFYFGKRYIAEHPLDTFRIIMVAQGSSEINEWHDGITPKNFLLRLIAQAAASNIDHTDMMLWGQGELINGSDNEQNYILRQDSLFATMRRQSWFSKDTKILVQGMPDIQSLNAATGLQDTSSAGHTAVDRWKQKSDHDGDAFTAYVPTVRLKANPPNGEIHYNALGLYEFGYNRMYEVYKNMPRNFYTEIGGLANTSWQVNGNNIPNGNASLFSKIGTRNTQSLEIIQNNVGKIQFVTGQTLYAASDGTYSNSGLAHNFKGSAGVDGFLRATGEIRAGTFELGNTNTTITRDGSNNMQFFAQSGYKFYTNSGANLAAEIMASNAFRLPKYGIGTYTGTPAYNLQVDAAGNLIETSVSAVPYDSVEVTTTNATPTTAQTIVLSNAEVSSIDVVAVAKLSDGNASFNANKRRAFLKNTAGTLSNGALQTIEIDQYLGTGLTTATFTITNSGSDVIIQATGEAAKTINWKFIIKKLKK